MPSALYRFHCTDGLHAVLDARGRPAAKEHLGLLADQVASAVMASCGARVELIDWSDWFVDVHDSEGRSVARVPFPPVTARPVGRSAPTGETTWG